MHTLHWPISIFGWIYIIVFPLVVIVAVAASFRIAMVGNKKFDKECKDFFTSREVKMLRKLES
jgi:hypothetical protein